MAMPLGINEDDQIVSMLARKFYVHFSEHRDKVPSAPPFAPEWAYDYARLAVHYCGYDDATAARLTEDYV